MRTATEWFELYGQSHQNPINKAIHWVCIPVIVLSTLGLLQAAPFPALGGGFLHWGVVVAVASLVFYASVSWTIMGGMAVFAGACLLVNHGIVAAGLPIGPVSIGLFLVAWLVQFVGHKIEGKKPSFLQDLQFLLIGPAWLIQFVYRRVGIPVETHRVALA